MGWQIAAATGLPAQQSDNSINVALIAALGAVVVALIGLGSAWLSRAARTAPSPPDADPRLGERVAVVETYESTNRRTLNQLDRHVDGIGDQVDRLRWEVDDLKAWREQHRNQHGQPT